jgi:pimeloyl-ACP methyl ester carboxylesterase
MDKGSLRTLMVALTPPGQAPPTEEQIKQTNAAFLAGQDTAALAAVSRGLPELAFTESQAAAIKVPTIALIGTADSFIEGIKKLKNAMPALKVVEIQKATHMTAPAQPEFIAALQEFLKANSIRK